MGRREPCAAYISRRYKLRIDPEMQRFSPHHIEPHCTTSCLHRKKGFTRCNPLQEYRTDADSGTGVAARKNLYPWHLRSFPVTWLPLGMPSRMPAGSMRGVGTGLAILTREPGNRGDGLRNRSGSAQKKSIPLLFPVISCHLATAWCAVQEARWQPAWSRHWACHPDQGTGTLGRRTPEPEWQRAKNLYPC